MKKSIADTFHAKLRTPWVWLVIVLTVGLTVLFYFSQKPQLVIYAQHTKSLAEYQLLETSLMRSMERVRSGFGADTLLVQSQTMTLREIAVSFCREMEDLRFLGSDIPASNMTVRFEREVLSKVAGMRRYVSARILWHEKWKDVSEKVESLPVETRTPLNALLDSARAGLPVMRSVDLVLPDSLSPEVDALLAENIDLANAWSRFDNDIAMMYCMDLVQFFQMKTMDEMSLKSRIPMVFYFLSIVLLLSTFFFLFRSKI
ncbi:hypothetical protein [uncultured Fibrobacter sp.]|jgi:hypothetical protein|uniref:hypothetical protein n=1 Tax=uncultured Fibrobacter sp. TaxID=261512 RepID=UPI001565B507|nr:hypothetical protein [uncultured Fibrobacter sp.]